MWKRSHAATDWVVHQTVGSDPDRALVSLFERLGGEIVARHGVTLWCAAPQLPVEEAGGLAALTSLQGRDGLWSTGAWWGFGTVEDAVRHGEQVASMVVDWD